MTLSIIAKPPPLSGYSTVQSALLTWMKLEKEYLGERLLLLLLLLLRACESPRVSHPQGRRFPPPQLLGSGKLL